ncbi:MULTISPECIES: hypothetical protein [Rhizobium]|uniref:Uncharacterized protein n=1 Tax=Rhizobium lusitanum TaxID=293958 RepID=A0A1C3XHH4_9HYPH|nr:hypothetical protein [Rhizobium lusitanum]SCB51698.1 hypothetical protein GA0061101_14216 [Rhizobium lusitanum]
MHELLEWLKDQKGGVRTFSDFRNMSLSIRYARPTNAALARLLGDLSGRFADAYDDQPLRATVADEAMSRLLNFVERAVAIEAATPEERLHLLNDIGVSELEDCN